MSEPIMAEFIGGPMDGNQRCLPTENKEVVAFCCDGVSFDESGKMKVVEHLYRRRSFEGVWCRLPNGFHPYDYKGVYEVEKKAEVES